MQRNQIMILAIEERQWEWAVYQTGGRKLDKIGGGTLAVPETADIETALPLCHDALLAQLREQKLTGARMRLALGLPTNDVLLRVLNLPTREPDELGEMSALQIEKVSPFGADQTVTGFEILSEDHSGSKVLAAGIDRERIEAIATALRGIGLKPERVDLNIRARWNPPPDTAEKPSDGEIKRIVHLLPHDNACDGVVTQNGLPVLFRELARRNQADEAGYLDELAVQTAYSLASCDLEQGPANATAASFGNFDEATAAGIKAALLQIGISETTSADTDRDLCAGLARRALQHASKTLNLAPAAWSLEETNRIRRRRLALTFAAAAALWLLTVGGIYATLWIERGRLEALERLHLEQEHPYEQARNIASRLRNLEQYTDQSRSALESLREISALQPPGIDLSSFDYRKGLMIRVGGEASNAALIYEFKNQLDASPLFSGTDAPSIARSARGDRETFRMTINLAEDGVATDQP